jgi:pimeloyl-ACP methyl ester carboxylesterase
MDKHYRKVPPDMREKFMRFRQEHPLLRAEIDGIPWEFIHCGDPSGQPLLLLPGGLSTAESAWRMISGLDHHKYSIVCPSYPAQISTMTALADGIAKILTREGIQTTYLLGGAYGSMLAQVFIHRHADIISRLVLTHAYPPLPSRVKSVNPTLRLFRWVPLFMVKNMLRTQMTGRLPPDPPAELLLIAAQIRETLDTQLTRQAAMSTYLRMVDFDKQNFTYTDMDSWPGKTLIILAEDDPTTTEDLRHAMLALYPGASLYLLKGSIQSTALLETEEYIRVMEAFFEDKPITNAMNLEIEEK